MFHVHYATHLKSESRVGGRTNTALSHSRLHEALRHPTALGEASQPVHDGSIIYRWGAYLQGNPYKCHLNKNANALRTQRQSQTSGLEARSSERWRPALEFGGVEPTAGAVLQPGWQLWDRGLPPLCHQHRQVCRALLCPQPVPARLTEMLTRLAIAKQCNQSLNEVYESEPTLGGSTTWLGMESICKRYLQK